MFHQRQKPAKDGGNAQYLDCSACSMSPVHKQSWHCGWLPRSQWRGDVGAYPRMHDQAGEHRPDEGEPDVCPGYLVSLPAVHETMRAWLHWDKGLDLTLRYDDVRPTTVLLDYVEELQGAMSGFERKLLARATEAK